MVATWRKQTNAIMRSSKRPRIPRSAVEDGRPVIVDDLYITKSDLRERKNLRERKKKKLKKKRQSGSTGRKIPSGIMSTGLTM